VRARHTLLLLLGACAAPRGGVAPAPQPAERPVTARPALPGAPARGPRQGDEIVVCGELFHTGGVPVVLWTDPGGYDAYSTTLRFGPAEGVDTPPEGKRRYHAGRSQDGRVLVPPGSRDLEALRAAVDLFVVHYDVCGCSRSCFKVLHDRRALSVHFMLDVDGTVYQTLDLRERAWHAGAVNTRSVGVELANIGSRRADDARGLAEIDAWYRTDAGGLRVQFPRWLGDGGVRTPDFVARPRAQHRVRGSLQGHEREQYDFTPEQYASLEKLTATLCRVLPRIRPAAPRNAAGRVATRVLDAAAQERFHGIVGHHHVSAAKQDPGPAFDWEAYLAGVRRHLARAAGS
jgi:N-acetyl-anhydromuramyl-L-alanine amidase AmpD